MNLSTWRQNLVSSYDHAAERYAETFFDELDRKPFDRTLLDKFADDVGDRGRICDLGCGPGHISRYLKARGADIFGVDLSSRMVEIASRLNPDITFRQGDMLALDLPDHALSGVVAFYSLIHLPRESVPRALQEIHRALRSDGRLLLSVHGGEGEIHTDEFLGLPVSMDATLFQRDEMAGYVSQAGFSVDHIATRQPYEFEFQSTRIYISATKKLA
jgi:SAM-dependent methyltransferase